MSETFEVRALRDLACERDRDRGKVE